MVTHPPELGRFFEDFQVGDVYKHPLGRTISETDNTWFTLLTCNTNQNHFNAVFAERSPVAGKIIVNSGLTVAIVLGQSVIDVSHNAIANLGWENIKLTHPVYVGDTLFSESVVTGTRKSRSRPYAGIVTARTRGLNQDGDEVLSWVRSVLIYSRDAPHHKGWFPEAKTGPLTVDGGE
ncbi:MAG: MaoC family dehydratase [Streptosporangiales bacterium]|nr:MaoC family dehydratase [Streptosporangiales bacterium]